LIAEMVKIKIAIAQMFFKEFVIIVFFRC